MNILSMIGGALTLRPSTFTALRERSDVFYRGFLVVLVVGLLAGAFAATADLLAPAQVRRAESLGPERAAPFFENVPVGEQRFIAQVVRDLPGIRADIASLPPRAGEESRPLVAVLRWLGTTLAEPFTNDFMGFLLIAGLLVHLTSRWLGGRANLAGMLGLTALAYAPDLLRPLSSLLIITGHLNASRLVLGVMVLWETVIYIKATAVAQGFSYSRALGALLIAIVVAVVLGILLAIILGIIFGGLFAAILLRG